ncbi:MAG: hypothetical protein DRO88_08620, partial [Promethearchaeia archaeon]
KFQQTFEQDYHRNLIDELTKQLNLTAEHLKLCDKKIKTQSLRITSKKPIISKNRKKLINKWISHKDNISQLIDFYQTGFNFWKQSLSKYDALHRSFTQKIQKIEQEINEKITQKDFSAAFEMNRHIFTKILEEINKYSQIFEKEINNKRKLARKLNSLYQTLFIEWNSLQYSLESLIQEKKRTFQNSITVDQRTYLTEAFQLMVESQITILNQKLVQFKQKFSSLIKHEKDRTSFNYSQEMEKLRNSLKKAKSKIQQEIDRLKKLKAELNYSSVLQNFENYEKSFKQEIQDIKQHYEQKQYIAQILKVAEKKNQNIFEVRDLAQFLNIPPGKMESIITQLISQNLINARVFGKSPKVEIHNNNWRNYQKIKQKSGLILREIQSKANMCSNFFNSAIIHHEFLEKSDQLNNLINEFNEIVAEKVDIFEDFLKSEKIDTKNNLVNQEYHQFYEEVSKIKDQIDNFQLVIEQAKIYHQRLKILIADLEDNGNSIINNIESEFRKTKKITQETHGKYLKSQWNLIKKEFEKATNQANLFQSEIINSEEIHEEIILDIEDNFQKNISEILQGFQAIFQNYENELKANETIALRDKMDCIIIEKQNYVNKTQRKMDIDIKNKIRSHEFISAAKKLNSRAKELQKLLKKAEKEIRNANKEYKNISKAYGIQYSSYILEEWLNFQKQFEESMIDGLYKVYAKELLYSFTTFSIKSFKETFVPLKLLSENLILNHNQIQHYLMALISEGMLPGKIDLEHDVYFEGKADFDEKSVARLEIIKKTNVKTYLKIQRLRNIFGILGPILTGFASFLTILWYLIRLSSNLIFIAIPIAAIIILFIFLWIRRGREQLSQVKQ